MRFDRRGMVLGVVILTSLMLGAFLFAYNRVVRQQNIRAHHEQIAEVASMLAMTGVNLLAEQMSSGFDAIIASAAPTLISAIMVSPTPAIVGQTTTMADLQTDFNAYLQQLTNLYPLPTCEGMEMSFEEIQQITPGTDDPQMQAGRDPVEKLGEIVISCTVRYQGLARKAKIKRQFRVVSMVPGAFSRFTLFVPWTPTYNSYNSLGVRYNGSVDPTYEHPFPTGQVTKSAQPLKLYNGTDSYSAGASVNAKADLANRGWVYLGPSHKTSAPDAVLLKVPSGYQAQAGGHFQVAMPLVSGGREVVPPENIEDPAEFNLPKPYATATCMIGGLYQGFFTDETDAAGVSTNKRGAAGHGLWPTLHVDPADEERYRWECAASWLFPFGDRDRPSRTLMIGNVLAGFLKFYFLKDISVDPPAWKFAIAGKVDPADTTVPAAMRYDPLAALEAPKPPTPAESPINQDLFKKPAAPDPSAGYDSFRLVMPVDLVPAAGVTGAPGVPYNILFEFMDYSYSGTAFPKLYNGCPKLEATGNPFYVPLHNTLNHPPAGGLKGIHPSQDVVIRFDENDGANPLDNFYFKGDLANYQINADNLLGRVTHIIDLSGCADQAAEDAALAAHLFEPCTEAALAGWVKPRKKGIFYIRRRSSHSGSPLNVPPSSATGLYVDQSFILIADKGNIGIPKKIRSEMPSSSAPPTKLCSLIALEGNVILGTYETIHAYVAALNPGTGPNGSGGGRLLCGTTNSVKEMSILGGLAIWEMGLYDDNTVRTTQGDFLNGGKITYNPRFNPSSALYPASREFIPEDVASAIEITGAD